VQGVGDAVDSFNLNATFFTAHGVPVLGAIFNKFPSTGAFSMATALLKVNTVCTTGFYSLQECQPAISSYFRQYQTDRALFGCLPLIEFSDSKNMEVEVPDQTPPKDVKSAGISSDEDCIKELVRAVNQYVNLAGLMYDTWIHNVSGLLCTNSISNTSAGSN
jgi:hypothetical protein